MNKERVVWVTRILGLAALYFLSAELDFLISTLRFGRLPLWIPSGVAFAALTVFGWRVLPGVFLGSAVVGWSMGLSLPLMVGNASAQCVEVFLGVMIFRRAAGAHPNFHQTKTVVSLALSAIPAVVFGAAIGVSSFVFAGVQPVEYFGKECLFWSMRNYLGIIIAVPFILSWLSRPRENMASKQAMTSLLLVLLFVAASVSSIFLTDALAVTAAALILLPFPLVIWMAVRFGLRGAVWGNLIACAIYVVAGILLDSSEPMSGYTRGHIGYLIIEGTTLATIAFTGLYIASSFDERQKASCALIESETRFRQLAENMEEVFWVQDAVTGELIYVSPAAERVWGCNRQELYQDPSCRLQKVCPADRKEAVEALSLDNCRLGFDLEYRLGLDDGSWRWIRDRGIPVLDDKGRTCRIVGIAEDVTTRKRAEIALLSEKDKLRLTLRSIGDGVITTNTHGAITFVNAATERLLGWTSHEALGRQLGEVLNIVDTKTRIPCADPVAVAVHGGIVSNNEECSLLVPRENKEVLISYSAFPISRPGEAVEGVVIVFQDITTRLALEKEMQKNQKLESVGLLAGGIAHDFNNMLTTILGNISLARLQDGLVEPVDVFLNAAEQAAERAKGLTKQLLTFSKGGMPITESASIAQLLRETANLALSGSMVSCEFDFAEDLHNVEIDTGQMEQVIHNLVINGAQSMASGGKIFISAQNSTLAIDNSLALTAGPYVRIEVRDEGAGIRAEYLGKIFDPFFTTKPQGSGLGLSTAFSVVAKHGGNISVVSEPGVGSTFSIHIPASTMVPCLDATKPETLGTGFGRVLLMDDDEDIRRMSERMLAAVGYEVVLAPEGQSALDEYRRAMEEGKPFKAVILDLTVKGGVGGLETIREMRRFDPSVKAIVSSGYCNDPVMADHERFGFSGKIAKPYDVKRLTEAILVLPDIDNDLQT